MGLGDEIMALGELERLYEMTGKPSRVVNVLGYDREHEAWVGNPAYDPKSSQKIMNGSNARPYILDFTNSKITFNHDYSPRAGVVYLSQDEIDFCGVVGDFCIIAPHTKSSASPNKSWGVKRWQKVVNGLKIPVYQLVQDGDEILEGVIPVKTKHWKHALSYIKKARFVLCNEGGTHHMAQSMGTMAFVVFGSFCPPHVTGYKQHCNFTVKDAHFCGNWALCGDCQNALEKITPDDILEKVNSFLEGQDVSGVYWL